MFRPTFTPTDLTQSKFGGLYTECDSRNLPMGASPLCYDVDFSIGGVSQRPGLTAQTLSFSGGSPSGVFQWLKTCIILGQITGTIAQDAGGGLYFENLASALTFTRLYLSPFTIRAISTTVGEREYICLSNLSNGVDQPRQWDGTNLDRISQVGPGSGPVVQSGVGNTNLITSITQPIGAKTINSICWGAYINLYNAPPAANTLFFLSATSATTFTTQINVGDIVYVSGCNSISGQNPNGTYTVTAIGTYTDVDGTRQYFGVVANAILGNFARGTAGSGAQFQPTAALVNISPPLAPEDAVVGNTVDIAQSSVTSWNGTWQITGTPTEGQLGISATSLTSNIATYDYFLESGNAPGWQAALFYHIGAQITDQNGLSQVWQVTTPGTSGGSIPSFPASPSPGTTQSDGGVIWTYQAGVTMPVTVFNTANGDGIFNVQNAIILSATDTIFTIALTGINIGSAAEQGEAISGSGATLTIDPGLKTLGTGSPGADPIYTAATDGYILVTTSKVAAGQRYAVLMFQTRNGYITEVSPPVSFYTTGQSDQLTFSVLPLGPPDVIARIVAFTAANAGVGGPYFYVPQDVTVPGTQASLGQTTTINKTVVPDNTSTSLGPITIQDDVLLNSINITEPGNNLLQQRELGECVKCIQYAGRTVFIGERVQIANLQNPTFDGGTVNSLPAGWQIATASTFSVSVVNSPIVNTSLEMANNTSTSTTSIAHFIMGANIASGSTSTVETLGWTPTVGNTLYFFFTSEGNLAVTPPAGLTLVNSYSTGAGGNGLKVYLWKRVVQSGDGGTWTFTHAGLSTTIMEWGTVEMVGTVPDSWEMGTATVTGVNSCASPSIGPLASSATVVAYFTMCNAGSATFTSGTPSPDPPYTFVDNDGQSSSIFTAAATSISAGAITSTNTAGVAANPIYVVGIFKPVGATNPTGTTLADIACIYQGACVDGFTNQIIQPATAYSVRVTAEVPTGTSTGALVVELYSPGLATNWPFTINLSSMTETIQEFIGAFNNPLWDTVPTDLQLRVYPTNLPATGQILVDRIEIFPTLTPYYTTQAAVSYLDNPEAIDGVTGQFDVSLFTSRPLTDLYVFINNQLELTVWNKTFRTSNVDGQEPSAWDIDEISNTAGECGPLSSEVGEEYALQASRPGLYLFDGGNHIKVSQEIQQIWNAIYWPSEASIWVKNDLENQRFYVGVPLPTPNQWLPGAPTNSTPATPNVILMCSYLSLPSGSAIAEALAVAPSMFTGHLIFKDGHRKWTLWQIPSAIGNYIDRPDSTQPFWLCGLANGQILALDAANTSDNGVQIPETYALSPFPDPSTEVQLQLGVTRKLFPYATALLEGSGKITVVAWPENLNSPAQYAQTQAPFALPQVELDDTNIPLNVTANRMFLVFSVYNEGLVLTLTAAATASGGNTVYAGTITDGAANGLVGQFFSVAGFATHTSNNGGPWQCVASTATTLTLANAAGVAETHAGTATETPGYFTLKRVGMAVAKEPRLGIRGY